jgi:peroxiredoxin
LIAQDFTGKDVPLSSVKAKYTLLLFYSPDCGHCIAEIPKIDSVYRAVLKQKGVKIYAFATEDESKWKEFVEKNKLQDWIHVADWKRHSGYFAKYDVNTTPSIYLLDEKKLIQGKKLDYSNIGQVIEMLEMQEKREKASARGK